jgi:hypothetical protein
VAQEQAGRWLAKAQELAGQCAKAPAWSRAHQWGQVTRGCRGLEVPEQLGHAARAEQLGQAGLVEQLGQAGLVEQLGQVAPVEQLGQVAPVEQLGQVGPVEQLGWAGPVEQLGQVASVEQLGRAVPVEQLGRAAPEGDQAGTKLQYGTWDAGFAGPHPYPWSQSDCSRSWETCVYTHQVAHTG